MSDLVPPTALRCALKRGVDERRQETLRELGMSNDD